MLILRLFAAVGRKTREGFAALGRAAGFLADIGAALLRVRTWGPQLLEQTRRVGVDSLPVALFIALFTGVVLALQSSYAFTGAVPPYFVGTLVGKSVIMELGPVLTGLVLAGRVGASIASELGTMRVTEQIDALETLGYEPVAYLVVPRVLAGLITMPIVVAFAIALGIAAGWVTSMVMLDLASAEFVRGLRIFHEPFDVQFALVKSASYGVVITAVGAGYGFHTQGGAEGVGRVTTSAVVVSAMLILLLDAFWAVVLL